MGHQLLMKVIKWIGQEVLLVIDKKETRIIIIIILHLMTIIIIIIKCKVWIILLALERILMRV
jgi:hypothetical protein